MPGRLVSGKVMLNEEISVKYDVDVLVVGGGAAGVGAAVAAARNGMNTLLVEREWSLGGLATLDLVLALGGFAEGISKEFLDNLEAEGALLGGRICDPEKAKYVMEQLVLKSGAKILYGTSVIDSIVEDNVIKGVIVHNKSGRQAILAKIVVDCSGDGDVAAYAGAPFEVGWEEAEGYNQAVSLDFVLSNVDLKKFEPRQFYSTIHMKIEKAVERGELPRLVERGYLGPLGKRRYGDRGEVYVCTAHSRRCRTTDAEDLTRIAIEQREQIQQLVKFYRKYVDGFENCWLSYTAPLLGVRDSRRIIGEYILTAEDIALARKFPDAIARDTHGFDIHNPITDLPHIKHTHLREAKEPAFCIPDEKGGYRAYLKPGEYYEIPYRCLVPLKVENLLVAGRCISTTFEAQSGTRLILTCMTMGQAAGTAAALAIKKKVTPRKLDPSILRETLIQQGVNLKEKPPLYVKGGPYPKPIPPDAKFEVIEPDKWDEIVVVDSQARSTNRQLKSE
jgi:succinate dehydrogenase/fumarate reductase flavoprotein subunit